MFQTFTGNSRRPRQVNLSGRNNNPFASVQTPQGSPAAVWQAQQDRKARQQERERLQAAKTVQRSWRGYNARKRLAAELRRKYDLEEEEIQYDDGGSSQDAQELRLLAILKLLLRFADPKRPAEDAQRISNFAKFYVEGRIKYPSCLQGLDWEIPLTRFTKLVLSVLDLISKEPFGAELDTVHNSLRFLDHFISLLPGNLATFSRSYYLILARLVPLCSATTDGSLLLQRLLTIPLLCKSSEAAIYEGLLLGLMTVPKLQQEVDFRAMARAVDPASLSSTIHSLVERSDVLKQQSHETLSWLLAYYTRVYRISTENNSPTHSTEMHHIAAVSILLSCLADDIRGQQNMHDTTASVALPEFVDTEITTLISQRTITNLLAHTEMIDFADFKATAYSEDASILASYVLTLLQVFPQRSDEIRMWLYMGSTSLRANTSGSHDRLPAIKFFYRAVFGTRVFKAICEEPRGAVKLLSTKQKKQLPNEDRTRLEHEWRVILLFLELYTFVLKIMDDEEFMSGGDALEEHKSWTRQSALKLSEVKELIVFLKNFAFAMYWYNSEINGNEPAFESRGLRTYFTSTNEIPSPISTETKQASIDPLIVQGIQSSAISYMKGTVTGLLRMLYERDSRRRFLPRDHWLMKGFDMSGFIGAVLEEQRHRNEHREDEDDADDIMEEDLDSYDRESNLVGTSRTQAVRRVERLRRQQQKATRRKRMEDTVPRLNILQNMPFFIPFATRVQIFREFVRSDQESRRNGFIDPDQWRMSIMQGLGGGVNLASRDQYIRKHSAKVRRDRIFEDAYEQFYSLGEGLKEPIQITFVDQFDTPEAGIDGGGVTKEFLTSITNEAFTPNGGLELFVENDQHLLYPNPEQVEKNKDFLAQGGIKEGSSEWNEHIRELLHQYEFLGRVVGKCLYEGILIDIHFAPFFLVKWSLTGGSRSATNESGYRANINDLRDLDEELYQGLLKLKNYPGNVEDFALDFTINDTISFDNGAESKTLTRELRPNGANESVTNENRLVYISYVARHRLQIQPYLQTSAFLRGLGSMIQPSWLSMFNQSELQTLIGGDSSEIDVGDLRRNTLYGGVYVIGDDGEEHPTIKLFWKVMEELSDEDRRKLLKYVTSTPRAPLLGFNQLNPPFSIRDSGSDQSRLPSTSTCVNLLKLPIYSNKQVLKDKLIYAINAGAGFNLS